MYYYYRKGAEDIFSLLLCSLSLFQSFLRLFFFVEAEREREREFHSMVAITLRPGGAPSTPREHHDEALKSEARAPFGDGGGSGGGGHGGGGSGGVGSYRELWMPFRNADGSSRPGDVCECAHKSRNARWKKKKRPASKWKVKKETTDDAVDAKSMCVLVYSFFRQSLLASKLATQTTVHTNSSICLAWYRFEFGRLR